MKFKHYLLVLFVFMLASCSEDDAGGDLTPDNASAQINAVAADMNTDVVTLVQSEGVEGAIALIDLMANSTEFGRISPYQANESRALVAQQAERIAHYFAFGVGDVLGEEPSDFTESKGIYEWIPSIEDFEKVADSDFIVVAFPSEGSLINNAEFRLTEFTVVEIDGDELPTTIKADLSVDDVKYIDLDFVVNYASDGNPEVADIFLDVIPFSLDIRFDDTEISTSSLAVILLLEGESLMGVDVDVEFSSEEKLEPIAVSGEVSYGDLRIVGSISDTEMDDSEDGDPNDYIDLDLFIGTEKAGDIVFIEEEIVEDDIVYLEYIPYVEYADGTQENLEDILEDVIEEIENLFEDLEDDED